MLMGQLRNLSLFVKINTFGVIFTIIIIGFICSIGIKGLMGSKYEYIIDSMSG